MNAERRFLFPAALDRQMPQGLSSFGPESGRRRDRGPFRADQPAGKPRMATEKAKGRKSKAMRTKERKSKPMRIRGRRGRFSGPFSALAGFAFYCRGSDPPVAFPEGVVRGKKKEKPFSKEDGAPEEGKRNLGRPRCQTFGIPVFRRLEEKSRLFCF